MSETALLDSDIPETILAGCKTAMPVVLRSVIAVVGHLVLYEVANQFAESAMIQIGIPQRFTAVVKLAVSCGAVYAAYAPMWTFLKDNLRDCSKYNMFKRFYREEIAQKGMTKDMAVRDAIEKVEIHNQYSRDMRRMNGGGGGGRPHRFQSEYW